MHRSSEGSPVAEDDAAAAFQIIMDSGRCSCTRLFSIPIRWSRHRLAMRSGGRITQLLAMSSGHQGHQLVVIRRVEHLARPGPRSVGLAANPEAASERCAFSILVHCSAPTLQLRLLLLRGLVQTSFAKLREPRTNLDPLAEAPHSFLNRASQVRVLPGAPIWSIGSVC